MKKIIALAAAMVGIAGASFGASFSVSAGATYLQMDTTNDTCLSPLKSVQCTGSGFFGPTVISVTAGSTIQLTAFAAGGMMNYGAISGVPIFDAVFSTSNALGALGTANRVTGALAAPAGTTGVVTNNYYSGSNDISQDFLITISTITITVPNTANFLFVGVMDSFYADNSGNLSVTVNQLASPEPATYALGLAGLAAMLLVRKIRA